MFWSAIKPSKKDSNVYIISNLWFRVTYITLHNLQNKNLYALLENSILCNVQIKARLNHHINSDYYLISHHWFSVAYIILLNFQNTNSQIFPTKTTHGNPITNYQQKKRKRKKKFEANLQAFTGNFSWISLSCLI